MCPCQFVMFSLSPPALLSASATASFLRAGSNILHTFPVVNTQIQALCTTPPPSLPLGSVGGWWGGAQLAAQDILRFLSAAAVAGQQILRAGNREGRGIGLLPVLALKLAGPSREPSSVQWERLRFKLQLFFRSQSGGSSPNWTQVGKPCPTTTTPSVVAEAGRTQLGLN